MKNTVITPNFLAWKFCGKTQFWNSFGQIPRNYAETVPFDKITMTGNYVIFRSVSVLFLFIYQSKLKKSDNIPTSNGNGIDDNSVRLKSCCIEYPLFSIRTHPLYSRWKGVPEGKYMVAYWDRGKSYGTSGFTFA